MNSRDEDRDLRETFALQRREEEKQVTGFHQVLEAARAERVRRSPTMLASAALAAAVLVALGLVIRQGLQYSRPEAPPETQPAAYLAEWTGPTAFLLRTPGHDFVSTLPTFALAMPALDRDARHPIPPHTPAQPERSSTP